MKRAISNLIKRCYRHWLLFWLGVLAVIWIVKFGNMLTIEADTPLIAESIKQTSTPKTELGIAKRANLAPQLVTETPPVTAPKCVRRPEHVLPRVHDTWYVYYKPPTHGKVYVFSAYMDQRPETPVIRLHAISSTIKNATYCQLWYENEEEPVVSELRITKNGRGHKISKVHYEQYYFTCTVTRPRPVLVSITSQPCETPQSLIPITYPQRGLEHEFAVCVPVTFGQVDPHRVVEWTEIHRILGVTEISVYYVHMSEETLKPFRYYESLGIMKLYNIPTVPHWENSYDGNKLSSMVSLNDCMYRNMYRYKWIIDIDFDEVIVPNSVNIQNYAQLLNSIDKSLDKKKYRPKSYTFRNGYFWKGCNATNGKPEKSVMLRHTVREKVSNYMYAPKSILSPLTCTSLFNHYCWHRLPTKERAFTIDVNSSIAFSHHYRNIPNRKPCDKLKKEGIQDLSIMNFKEPLEKRYTAVTSDMQL